MFECALVPRILRDDAILKSAEQGLRKPAPSGGSVARAADQARGLTRSPAR
jgi:hypothetical protein